MSNSNTFMSLYMYISVYAKLLFSDFSFSVTTLSIYFYTDTFCAILLVILRINVEKKREPLYLKNVLDRMITLFSRKM